MESLLERGEKLDDLVAKSEHLGTQSKAFYKTVSVKEPVITTRLNIWWLFSVSPAWLSLSLCVLVHPAGTETELMLWDHVMPPLRGHASLCLSAFPTTPIMHLPPAVNTKDRTDAVSSGMKGRARKGGGPLKCDLSRLWLMGAEGEWWGLVGGRSNFWIIFKLSKGKRRCGVPIPVEDLIMWRLFGDVLSKHHLLSFWVTWISIVWFQRALTRVMLLPQGDWQSQSLS